MAEIEASLLVKTSQLDTTYLSMDSNNRSITEDQPIRREVSHGVNAAPPKMTNVKKTMITSMDEDVQSDEHLEVHLDSCLLYIMFNPIYPILQINNQIIYKSITIRSEDYIRCMLLCMYIRLSACTSFVLLFSICSIFSISVSLQHVHNSYGIFMCTFYFTFPLIFI